MDVGRRERRAGGNEKIRDKRRNKERGGDKRSKNTQKTGKEMRKNEG